MLESNEGNHRKIIIPPRVSSFIQSWLWSA